MLMRTTAAMLNGILVLALYVSAWGVHTFTIALVEVALAVTAALATWYALKRTGRPPWLARLFARAASARPRLRRELCHGE
jgi:hypothetical protein